MPRDPVRVAIHVLVYVVIAYLSLGFFFWGLGWMGQPLVLFLPTALASVLANWLTLRIFEQRPLWDVGLWWNSASRRNLGIGVAAGACAAGLAIVPLLAAREGHLVATTSERPTVGSIALYIALIAFAALGEELLCRGYAFQTVLRAVGPYATILPFGVLFAALHAGNPDVGWIALINTGLFGIAFGYAYLRSRDLWLPVGLHLGWNVTLPLFGVHLSWLRMNVTGYEMSWNAGALWSGGDYGPEASLLTSV